MIEISNLHKSFGAQQVLCGVSFTIEKGSRFAVVGPSGVGKSVMIKIITGLLPAEKGEIRVDGHLMSGAASVSEQNSIRERMGILFQAAALFDSISLFENVAFPLKKRGKLSKEEIVSRSLQALEDVGLSGYEWRLPGEVSIGIRKRVGIARALVTEPEIVLFDEPNTGLDPLTGQEIYELIDELHQKNRFTAVVISHEIPEVFQVCEQVVMLYNGKIQFLGTVADFLASGDPVVQQFASGNVEGPIKIA